MATFLLDTDAIIDQCFSVDGSISLINRLYDQGESLCLCSVVIAEVYAGLRPQHRNAVEEILSSYSFLPTSLDAATKAGEWCYAYARRGITLSLTDMLVAGTAYSHGATIVTGNIHHYPMEDISLLPLPRSKP